MQKTRLELFYSRGRLLSWEAKRKFVDSDLAPFTGVHEAHSLTGGDECATLLAGEDEQVHCDIT